MFDYWFSENTHPVRRYIKSNSVYKPWLAAPLHILLNVVSKTLLGVYQLCKNKHTRKVVTFLINVNKYEHYITRIMFNVQNVPNDMRWVTCAVELG